MLPVIARFIFLIIRITLKGLKQFNTLTNPFNYQTCTIKDPCLSNDKDVLSYSENFSGPAHRERHSRQFIPLIPIPPDLFLLCLLFLSSIFATLPLCHCLFTLCPSVISYLFVCPLSSFASRLLSVICLSVRLSSFAFRLLSVIYSSVRLSICYLLLLV